MEDEMKPVSRKAKISETQVILLPEDANEELRKAQKKWHQYPLHDEEIGGG
ncbi:MAG: hypothetical protein J0L97_06455 [Alphaproteobacteria bacterium]|nr:hypothetical protein [Alphaproteobacteria bacterium]